MQEQRTARIRDAESRVRKAVKAQYLATAKIVWQLSPELTGATHRAWMRHLEAVATMRSEYEQLAQVAMGRRIGA